MIDLLISGGIGVVVTIVGKLAYDGSKFGKKPFNGSHVLKVDCDKNIDKITKSIENIRTDMIESGEKLHNKINKANEGIVAIEGYLKGKSE
jgi:hypothetical protein